MAPGVLRHEHCLPAPGDVISFTQEKAKEEGAGYGFSYTTNSFIPCSTSESMVQWRAATIWWCRSRDVGVCTTYYVYTACCSCCQSTSGSYEEL